MFVLVQEVVVSDKDKSEDRLEWAAVGSLLSRWRVVLVIVIVVVDWGLHSLVTGQGRVELSLLTYLWFSVKVEVSLDIVSLLVSFDDLVF